jgi:hypothetical protein
LKTDLTSRRRQRRAAHATHATAREARRQRSLDGVQASYIRELAAAADPTPRPHA